MIIAPTEPPRLRALGKISLAPEAYGADVLFTAHSKLVGIQRKEYADLLSSIFHSERLYKELAQMKRLSTAALIIEGNPHFTTDGMYQNPNRRKGTTYWTRVQHHNLIASIQMRFGITVFQTTDLDDTISAIRSFESWMMKKDRTSSLLRREKPKGEWGVRTNRDFATHVLQSFPHIGPKQAEAIVNVFNGLPLTWTCTEDEMKSVPGVGPKTVRDLFKALPEPTTTSTEP